MTIQEKQTIMKFIEQLINENLGNRITPALGNGLYNQIGAEIEKISKAVPIVPNDANDAKIEA